MYYVFNKKLEEIQTFMGHTDLKTTRRYLLDESDYAKAKSKEIRKDIVQEFPKLIIYLTTQGF